MKHFTIATLVGTGAVITGALFAAVPAAPAFAVCNEGTPNCLRVDAGHQKVQDQLNSAETSGQCAGPDGFCDDSIPGSDVEPQRGAATPTTKPVASHAPTLVK
ncbi:hypothetical protein Mycsm_06721 (plasmid) [Mycobacterium sp. JS623]|uniref:hypothetical protein n=1 Tax=Mycobacterium sp. JS623 TaxID=212767 RepID=UPI0002A58C04|nr:hypothetical protein [Mycobacterium sp. JS623]AGB26837.1 hypothetical protein Mycsm_06721 [Mycobacterium sp. JS623]